MQLNGDSSVLKPRSFIKYLRDYGLAEQDTAPAISVDFLERLPLALRKADTMVLRLGKADDGPGTQFTLVSVPGRLADFFLQTGPVPEPEPFLPPVPPANLLPYGIFKNPTETTLVNLAFASGLIGHALDLDGTAGAAVPVAGSSTYTFDFRPHSSINTVLNHRDGQVEIDAVFGGTRRGRAAIFILEAKTGASRRTLAKHKLMYPVLALHKHIPNEMDIVPVYLRVLQSGTTFTYYVTECGLLSDPRKAGTIALDELCPKPSRAFSLTL